MPEIGTTMAGISSGRMRDAGDAGYVAPNSGSNPGSTSTPPATYLAAHYADDPALKPKLRAAIPAYLGAAMRIDGLTLADLEREYIERVLQAEGGNKTRAAARLGLDRKTLYRKLEEYRATDSTGQATRSVGEDDGTPPEGSPALGGVGREGTG